MFLLLTTRANVDVRRLQRVEKFKVKASAMKLAKTAKRIAAVVILGACAFCVGGEAARAQISSDSTSNVLREAFKDYRSDVAYTYRGGYAFLHLNGKVSGRLIPKSFIDYANQLESAGKKIRSIAFRKNGGWVAVYGNYGFRASNVPSALLNELQRANANKETIYCVAISPRDGWVVFTSKKWRWGGDIPVELRERMNLASASGGALRYVTFNSSGGWRLLYLKDGERCWRGASPTEEQKKILPKLSD